MARIPNIGFFKDLVQANIALKRLRDAEANYGRHIAPIFQAPTKQAQAEQLEQKLATHDTLAKELSDISGFLARPLNQFPEQPAPLPELNLPLVLAQLPSEAFTEEEDWTRETDAFYAYLEQHAVDEDLVKAHLGAALADAAQLQDQMSRAMPAHRQTLMAALRAVKPDSSGYERLPDFTTPRSSSASSSSSPSSSPSSSDEALQLETPSGVRIHPPKNLRPLPGQTQVRPPIVPPREETTPTAPASPSNEGSSLELDAYAVPDEVLAQPSNEPLPPVNLPERTHTPIPSDEETASLTEVEPTTTASTPHTHAHAEHGYITLPPVQQGRPPSPDYVGPTVEAVTGTPTAPQHVEALPAGHRGTVYEALDNEKIIRSQLASLQTRVDAARQTLRGLKETLETTVYNPDTLPEAKRGYLQGEIGRQLKENNPPLDRVLEEEFKLTQQMIAQGNLTESLSPVATEFKTALEAYTREKHAHENSVGAHFSYYDSLLNERAKLETGDLSTSPEIKATLKPILETKLKEPAYNHLKKALLKLKNSIATAHFPSLATRVVPDLMTRLENKIKTACLAAGYSDDAYENNVTPHIKLLENEGVSEPLKVLISEIFEAHSDRKKRKTEPKKILAALKSLQLLHQRQTEFSNIGTALAESRIRLFKLSSEFGGIDSFILLDATPESGLADFFANEAVFFASDAFKTELATYKGLLTQAQSLIKRHKSENYRDATGSEVKFEKFFNEKIDVPAVNNKLEAYTKKSTTVEKEIDEELHQLEALTRELPQQQHLIYSSNTELLRTLLERMQAIQHGNFALRDKFKALDNTHYTLAEFQSTAPPEQIDPVNPSTFSYAKSIYDSITNEMGFVRQCIALIPTLLTFFETHSALKNKPGMPPVPHDAKSKLEQLISENFIEKYETLMQRLSASEPPTMETRILSESIVEPDEETPMPETVVASAPAVASNLPTSMPSNYVSTEAALRRPETEYTSDEAQDAQVDDDRLMEHEGNEAFSAFPAPPSDIRSEPQPEQSTEHAPESATAAAAAEGHQYVTLPPRQSTPEHLPEQAPERPPQAETDTPPTSMTETFFEPASEFEAGFREAPEAEVDATLAYEAEAEAEAEVEPEPLPEPEAEAQAEPEAEAQPVPEPEAQPVPEPEAQAEPEPTIPRAPASAEHGQESTYVSLPQRAPFQAMTAETQQATTSVIKDQLHNTKQIKKELAQLETQQITIRTELDQIISGHSDFSASQAQNDIAHKTGLVQTALSKIPELVNRLKASEQELKALHAALPATPQERQHLAPELQKQLVSLDERLAALPGHIQYAENGLVQHYEACLEKAIHARDAVEASIARARETATTPESVTFNMVGTVPGPVPQGEQIEHRSTVNLPWYERHTELEFLNKRHLTAIDMAEANQYVKHNRAVTYWEMIDRAYELSWYPPSIEADIPKEQALAENIAKLYEACYYVKHVAYTLENAAAEVGFDDFETLDNLVEKLALRPQIEKTFGLIYDDLKPKPGQAYTSDLDLDL